MQVSGSHCFQEKLLSIKPALLNKSTYFKTDKPEAHVVSGDEADQASSEINLNLSLRLHERERLLIQKIDYALAKIKDGAFGQCEDCGGQIEEKRLFARPYTTLCIACKEEQEYKKQFYA